VEMWRRENEQVKSIRPLKTKAQMINITLFRYILKLFFVDIHLKTTKPLQI